MDITEEEKNLIRQKVEKLKNSRFKQQTLPAWRPIPSFRSTMITFTVFGVIFLGLGILLYIMSDQIQEVGVLTYDDNLLCKDAQGNAKSPCTVELQINDTIKAPVYVYYQLDNFYQNHRRYVKSRSFNQLKGDYLTVDKLSDCDPIKKVSDLSGYQQLNLKKVQMGLDDPAIPCGLVAKSFFNDTYVLKDPKGISVAINDKNIAWESDRQYKFKNTVSPPSGKTYEDIQWINMEDGNTSLIKLISFRALHRVDENSRFAQLQKALGQDRDRHHPRDLLGYYLE